MEGRAQALSDRTSSPAAPEGPLDTLGDRMQRAARLVASTRLVAITVGLAASPLLVTLSHGLASDDHIQYRMVRRASPPPWDLFKFASGDVAETLSKIRHGEIPWFVAPELKYSFFRPLDSLTHWVEYRWLGSHPWILHLHNLAWFTALVVAVGWVYRAFEGERWTAGLATIVYVCSPAAAWSVAWLAGRNALMATAFGMAALGAHHRSRAKGLRGQSAALALLAA